MIFEKGKRIIWLDKNVKSQENTNYLRNFANELKSKSIVFLLKTSISETIELLKKMSFSLVYIIVSRSYAEEFFNEYTKIVNNSDIKVIYVTIVFCFNLKKHSSKAYFKDPFLNPRGVVNNFKAVINYINKDECH